MENELELNKEELKEPETTVLEPFGIATGLSQLIIKKWELIDSYNSLIATLSQLENPDAELINKLQDELDLEYDIVIDLENLVNTNKDDTDESVSELIEN